MTSDLQSTKVGGTPLRTSHDAVIVLGVAICSGIMIALSMIFGITHHEGLLAVYLAINILLCVATFGESGQVMTRVGAIKLGVLAVVVLLQLILFLTGKQTIQFFYLVLPVGLLEGSLWIERGRARSKHEMQVGMVSIPDADPDAADLPSLV